MFKADGCRGISTTHQVRTLLEAGHIGSHHFSGRSSRTHVTHIVLT